MLYCGLCCFRSFVFGLVGLKVSNGCRGATAADWGVGEAGTEMGAS